MNASKMKNMIVIKDLPSNLIDEAYVILKPGVKLTKKEEKTNESQTDLIPNYIVYEAESVVSNYLSNMEDNKKVKNLEIDLIRKKYSKLKRISLGLGILFVLNLLIQINC